MRPSVYTYHIINALYIDRQILNFLVYEMNKSKNPHQEDMYQGLRYLTELTRYIFGGSGETVKCHFGSRRIFNSFLKRFLY